MKIHKMGVPPPDKIPPYWAGTRMVCECGCIFELDAEDEEIVQAERDLKPGGKSTVAAFCPTIGCGLQVTTVLRG